MFDKLFDSSVPLIATTLKLKAMKIIKEKCFILTLFNRLLNDYEIENIIRNSKYMKPSVLWTIKVEP